MNQKALSINKNSKELKNSRIKEISSKLFADDSTELKLSKLLFSLIQKRNHNHKQPDLQKWANDIDLMLRIDKRNPSEIEKVINWCQHDNFWKNNILSTQKLRKQFDKLILIMEADDATKKDTGAVKSKSIVQAHTVTRKYDGTDIVVTS
jgi:hypothetical protein